MHGLDPSRDRQAARELFHLRLGSVTHGVERLAPAIGLLDQLDDHVVARGLPRGGDDGFDFTVELLTRLLVRVVGPLSGVDTHERFERAIDLLLDLHRVAAAAVVAANGFYNFGLVHSGFLLPEMVRARHPALGHQTLGGRARAVSSTSWASRAKWRPHSC